MEQKPINPLVKHFRRPAIYFKLPSNGNFWEEGTLDLPVTGEIPVYPMTTADELTLKTPDALMNGSGIVSVIQSCCPNIRDAWKMPSIDVDAVLIAIRIASYGENMPISSKCPHCGEEHDYDVNLTGLISQVKSPNFDTPIEYDGLKIKLKPQHYFTVNRNNIVTFEEQRILQSLNDDKLDDDVKTAQITKSMQNLLNANIELLVGSTDNIETEDGVKVKEHDFLVEFYKNAESRATKEIESRLAKIATEGALPPIHLGCAACSKEYDTPLEFDYARFFA
jgi:hypothetical protein